MSFRYDAYKIKRGDNLADPALWNPKLQDIDLRLAAREADAPRIDAALDEVEAKALDRLAETFTPLIVEAQGRLNNLGVSFSGESTTEATIAGSGTLNLNLTEATAANYVYTDYVSVRSAVSPQNQMLAQVTSFTRASRLLTMEIVSSEGSGTFSDWLIRVGTPPETGHATRTDNPHETTAAQVGAYTIAQTLAAIASEVAEAVEALPPISSALLKANNLSDLTDVGAARGNLGLGSLATSNTVGSEQIASNVFASVANFRSGTADKVLQTDTVFEAADYVSLTDAATIAVNLSAGFNFTVTLTTSRVLGFPTSPKVGQSGYIEVVQPGGGNCTLGFESGYVFDIGIAPTLDLTASRKTVLYYHVRTASVVLIGTAFKGYRAS